MKILCTSLFKNTWMTYWTKFLSDRGHTVSWLIGYDKTKAPEAVEKAKLSDAVLCMWGSVWAKAFLESDIKTPVYVICRSFEMFQDTGTPGIKSIPLEKAKRVFMLNESHYELFNRVHPSVKPIFIKNGIDVNEWELQKKPKNGKVAWICNLNFKKGALLISQVIYELKKIDPTMTLEHIGNINSRRDYLYLQNIMPYLHTRFFNNGYSNSHDFVKSFLSDKRYLVSCSLVEGHPMNILEAMATGTKPLIHRYPGVEHQFPEEYIWNSFDELTRIYDADYNPERYRQFIIDNYDYRKVYKPVAEVIENV